jgi:hypothetical protein
LRGTSPLPMDGGEFLLGDDVDVILEVEGNLAE